MAISNQDLIKVLDLSGQTNVAGTDINQILDTATPYSDKGLVMMSADVAGNPVVPDAATTTKWANYLWLRVGASAVNLYLWNPTAASDATYLKWQAVNLPNVPAGSITNNMLAGGITADKILAVAFSVITGMPTWFSGSLGSIVASGDLTGNYPNPTIANDAVTTVKVLDYNITPAKLSLGTFFYLGTCGGSLDAMTVAFAGTIAYAAGVTFRVTATAGTFNTTTTPTINIGGTGAVTLLDNDGGALWPGAIQAGDLLDIVMVSGSTARVLNLSHKKATVSFGLLSALSTNTLTSTAHGLGGVPKRLRAYIECTTADAATGHLLGQQVELWNIQMNAANYNPPYNIVLDTTNVSLIVSASNTPMLRSYSVATVGDFKAITKADWTLKCDVYM